MREICTYGSEEGPTRAIWRVYSPVRANLTIYRGVIIMRKLTGNPGLFHVAKRVLSSNSDFCWKPSCHGQIKVWADNVYSLLADTTAINRNQDFRGKGDYDFFLM